MSQNIRFLAARFHKSVSRLSSAPRREAKIPLSVSLELDRAYNGLRKNNQSLTVAGYTADMSKTEIAFVVPFIRLGEDYLVSHGGEQKRLKLVLELPNGTVRMTVETLRYEMIQIHDSVQNYLIGANIVQISEGDAERYENFLRHGEKAANINQNIACELAPAQEKRSLLSYLSIF